jgi:hypothetical protein
VVSILLASAFYGVSAVKPFAGRIAACMKAEDGTIGRANSHFRLVAMAVAFIIRRYSPFGHTRKRFPQKSMIKSGTAFIKSGTTQCLLFPVDGGQLIYKVARCPIL